MKALVLGGTGAIGVHLVDLLVEKGYRVTVTSRQNIRSTDNIEYKKGNAKDFNVLDSILSAHWDVIVDFMIWSTSEFRQIYRSLLDATNHYIFTSSYRVYADAKIITEESPRLLDVISDKRYLNSDEYALKKARCENLLIQSNSKNWTIVRPAITYDGSGRFQLTIYEAPQWLWRVLHGLPVPLPEVLLSKQTTMTSGEDVALMISRLTNQSFSLGEIYNVCTSEHHTWSEIIDYYREVIPGITISDCELTLFEKKCGSYYQLVYDRMYDRIVDNSKILAATGLCQESFKSINEGIVQELSSYLNSRKSINTFPGYQARLDQLVGCFSSFAPIVKEDSLVGMAKYLIKRFI